MLRCKGSFIFPNKYIHIFFTYYNQMVIILYMYIYIYKDGVHTSVHNYHYAKNSVRQFPQSSVQNFMRDRPLFLHSSTWYLVHSVSRSSHTQSGPGSRKYFVAHIL